MDINNLFKTIGSDKACTEVGKWTFCAQGFDLKLQRRHPIVINQQELKYQKMNISIIKRVSYVSTRYVTCTNYYTWNIKVLVLFLCDKKACINNIQVV